MFIHVVFFLLNVDSFFFFEKGGGGTCTCGTPPPRLRPWVLLLRLHYCSYMCINSQLK